MAANQKQGRMFTMSLTVAKCVFCGLDFEYDRVTKPKRFCSVLCGSRHRQGFMVIEVSCDLCGKVCVNDGGSGGRNKRFCSDVCRRSAQNQHWFEVGKSYRAVTDCLWCLQSFEPRQFGQKHCSESCRVKHLCHKSIWGDQLCCAIPVCKCGRQVLHDVGVSRLRPPRSEMCRDCRAESHRLQDIARGSGKRKARRAVFKAGERFTKLDLVQRWGCVCYLCGTEVSFDRSLPLRNRPSIDHVIPIFSGGEHTIQNCRVVHFSCNSAKGAKIFGLELVN